MNLKIGKNKYLILMAILLASFFLFQIGIEFKAHPKSYGQGDFTVFYSAGEALIKDVNPYIGKEFKKIVRNNRDYEAGFRYLYPPFAAIFFVPLLIFSQPQAAIVWIITNMALLFLMAWCTQYLADKKFTVKEWCLIAAACIPAGFIFSNFRLGQINVLLGLILILHLICLKKEKTSWAGFLLSILIMIKVFPVVLIIPYLFKKQWRLIGSTILGLGVILGFSIIIFGITPHLSYAERITKLAVRSIDPDKGDVPDYDNPTINGTLYRLVTYGQSNNYLGLGEEKIVSAFHLIIAAIIFLLLIIVTFQNRQKKPHLWEAFLWLSFVFLVAKEIQSQYFILFLPAYIILFLNFNYLFKKKKTIFSLAIILSYLAFCFSFPEMYKIVLKNPATGLIPLAFYGNLIFFALMFYLSFYAPSGNTKKLKI